jgi:hypothetical protein
MSFLDWVTFGFLLLAVFFIVNALIGLVVVLARKLKARLKRRREVQELMGKPATCEVQPTGDIVHECWPDLSARKAKENRMNEHGEFKVTADAAGDRRWDALKIEPGVTSHDLRASEGYRHNLDNARGARCTLEVLLYRVIAGRLESIAFRESSVGGITLHGTCPNDRERFTIYAANGEQLAVQGPVDGFASHEEAVAALNRATVTLLAAHLRGEF